MNNITLSADKEVIEQARKLFSKRGTTINAEFRKWIASKAVDEGKRRSEEFEKMMESIGRSKIGKMPTREEMNER